MNTRVRLLMICLLVISTNLIAFAKEKPSEKKAQLEVGVGINTFGPAKQMDELMVQYHFDHTTPCLLFCSSDKTIEHPHYESVGFTSHLSYSQDFKEHRQLGLMLKYTYLREVYGASAEGGYLFVRFSNVSVVPVYTCELDRYWELIAGPALLINSGNKTSSPLADNENYTAISPGILLGTNLKVWDRRVTFGKLGIHYLATIKNKMGPYTAESFENSAVIPESKIGFSHLDIKFIFGIHL